jgi:hypothetical protein
LILYIKIVVFLPDFCQKTLPDILAGLGGGLERFLGLLVLIILSSRVGFLSGFRRVFWSMFAQKQKQ